MKNNIFAGVVVSLAFLLHGFFNIDILLPALALVIFLNRKRFSEITVSALVVYSFVGSFVWFKSFMPALVATLFVTAGVLSSFFIFKHSEQAKGALSWGLRLVAVIVYDNVASLPMFYAAFISGGFSKLWLQILAGVPFTAKHLLSFLVFYAFLRVANYAFVKRTDLVQVVS